MILTLEIELPADLARLRLPQAVAARLQALLSQQASGQALTDQERAEAEGLVNLAEFFTLLRLRAERLMESEYDDSPWTSQEREALAWEAGKSAGWEDMDEYDDAPEKP
jgi:hypothetical protein